MVTISKPPIGASENTRNTLIWVKLRKDPCRLDPRRHDKTMYSICRGMQGKLLHVTLDEVYKRSRG